VSGVLGCVSLFTSSRMIPDSIFSLSVSCTSNQACLSVNELIKAY
jgi:hypothetical protein